MIDRAEHAGTVIHVNVARGFEFLRCPAHARVFFHASNLSTDLSFDETLLERRVRFEIGEDPRGPQAFNVQPAD